nr:ATP synthase protein 8 [Amblypomacentrus breviceps]
MPQLNPTPWFTVLCFAWLVFASIIPSKVISHDFSPNPTHQSTSVPSEEPWTWPWY